MRVYIPYLYIASVYLMVNLGGYMPSDSRTSMLLPLSLQRSKSLALICVI